MTAAMAMPGNAAHRSWFISSAPDWPTPCAIRQTAEPRTASGQNRTSPAPPAVSRTVGTRLWCSIHARVAGEIHPATSRIRS